MQTWDGYWLSQGSDKILAMMMALAVNEGFLL